MRGGMVCLSHGGGAPQVRRKAAERLADLVDPQRVLREAALIAYSDIRTLLDEQGQLLPASKWPDAVAAAVSGIEVTKRNLTAGDGAQEDVVKVKLWDKMKAIELLMRHLQLLEPAAQAGGVNIERVLVILDEGRARVAAALESAKGAAPGGV